MKNYLALICSSLVLIGAAGCGGQDRSSLAKHTVQNYWSNIADGKMKVAWKVLTPGQEQANPYPAWSANLVDFLKSTNGIKARVGEPSVSGDNASVPVTIGFNKAPDPRNDQHGYQHLFWQNGSWRIVDESGTLTKSKK